MPRWRESDERRVDRFGDKGKRRRQPKQSTNQNDPWEKEPENWVLGGDTKQFSARVVEVHKRYCFVSPEPDIGSIDTRDPWLATVARRHLTTMRTERNFVAVGDRVLARPANDRDALVESELPVCVLENVAPRKSKLSRPDPMLKEREHVLAANIDQLLIVASYRAPKIRWALIDRYLVLAEEQGLPVAIVLTKEDLLEDDEFHQDCEHNANILRKIGYDVFSLSLISRKKSRPLLAELAKLLDGRFTIFSGHSGVGKSSLINSFKPEIQQEVEPEPEGIKTKGRHTTTYASLIKLKTGGYVIDTPGIRSFAMAERSSLEWSYGFREIRSLIGSCKFRECRHIDEPECAVVLARDRGAIDLRRYQSYANLVLGETGREGRLRDREQEFDDNNEEEL